MFSSPLQKVAQRGHLLRPKTHKRWAAELGPSEFPRSGAESCVPTVLSELFIRLGPRESLNWLINSCD